MYACSKWPTMFSLESPERVISMSCDWPAYLMDRLRVKRSREAAKPSSFISLTACALRAAKVDLIRPPAPSSRRMTVRV